MPDAYDDYNAYNAYSPYAYPMPAQCCGTPWYSEGGRLGVFPLASRLRRACGRAAVLRGVLCRRTRSLHVAGAPHARYNRVRTGRPIRAARAPTLTAGDADGQAGFNAPSGAAGGACSSDLRAANDNACTRAAAPSGGAHPPAGSMAEESATAEASAARALGSLRTAPTPPGRARRRRRVAPGQTGCVRQCNDALPRATWHVLRPPSRAACTARRIATRSNRCCSPLQRRNAAHGVAQRAELRLELIVCVCVCVCGWVGGCVRACNCVWPTHTTQHATCRTGATMRPKAQRTGRARAQLRLQLLDPCGLRGVDAPQRRTRPVGVACAAVPGI